MKENIEEDLKKIESLIEGFRKAEIVNLECKESMYQRCNYSHYKALENILSDYKRVLKENEELKDKWDKDTHKLQNDLDIANAEKIEIQKENEELKSDNYELNNRINDLLDSIPIQKIKGKIEELNEYYKKEIYPERFNWADVNITEYYDDMIELLQDLLEEKGE